MNYEECLDYLNRLGNEVLTMKFGLDTIRAVLDGLERPQDSFRSVLIAGTNGKGSVARFLAGITTTAGIRTGLYTSPHLVRLTERIKVDGREVDPVRFAECFTEVVETVRTLDLESHPTFFEMITATAFRVFAREQIELAVLEIGMGGRLDSTNVVEPILSIITPIDWDHQQYLGDTLPKIAGEKAGIMRPGVPALSSAQSKEVAAVLRERASALGTSLEFQDMAAVSRSADPDGCYQFSHEGIDYGLHVSGRFQVDNAMLAVRAAQELRRLGFSVRPDHVAAGIGATEFQGVVQRSGEKPVVVIDGGHNPAAALALGRYLGRHTPSPRHLVFAMMRDKEVARVLAILQPLCERIFLTQIDSPRAAAFEDLIRLCPLGIPVPNPRDAYGAAFAGAETVVVAGSFFLAGAILAERG